jgi:hypothetical protein
MADRRLFVFFVLLSTSHAQWLNFRTPGTPRTLNGKPILTSPAPRAPDGKPDLSGLWNIDADATNVFRNLKPEAIQPSAAALRKQRLENINQDSPSIACLPLGPLYAYSNVQFEGLKIVQTRNLILILNADLTYRQIFLDGRDLPTDPNPSWMGYSIGHWEGDILVVESSGFNDRTWLDFSGYPHSEALRMTERFHRVDLGHMDLEVTFLDPKTYAKPLTFTAKMDAIFDTEPLEYVCAENEKDRPHLVGKPSDVKTVDVPVALLAAYVGEYEAQPPDGRSPFIVTVVLKDGVLTLSRGSNSMPLRALSETTFTLFDGSPLEFVKDDRGEVTHFTFRVVEGDMRANRKSKVVK